MHYATTVGVSLSDPGSNPGRAHTRHMDRTGTVVGVQAR